MNDTAEELAERYSKAIGVVADLQAQLAAERTTVSSLLVDLAAEKARADKAEAAVAEMRRRIENARDRLLRGDDDNALLKLLCGKDDTK